MEFVHLAKRKLPICIQRWDILYFKLTWHIQIGQVYTCRYRKYLLGRIKHAARHLNLSASMVFMIVCDVAIQVYLFWFKFCVLGDTWRLQKGKGEGYVQEEGRRTRRTLYVKITWKILLFLLVFFNVFYPKSCFFCWVLRFQC